MKIEEVIAKVKAYHLGVWNGKVIDPTTTRDQVLYGNPDQTCTGIVTTCWASLAVIQQAAAQGANLIICHEALFWNHGDHTDWLEETSNQTYAAKVALLEANHIVVWRDHDHIHSGIPLADGTYIDGIFYGLAKQLGWAKYLINDADVLSAFKLPAPTTAKAVAAHLITQLHLNGARIIGDPATPVQKIAIPMHVLGDAKAEIAKADKNQYDLFISLEMIDYTLSEYIQDASLNGQNKAIVAVGHFNVEEPGMAYLATYLPNIIGSEIPVSFVQSGDMYHYIKA